MKSNYIDIKWSIEKDKGNFTDDEFENLIDEIIEFLEDKGLFAMGTSTIVTYDEDEGTQGFKILPNN